MGYRSEVACLITLPEGKKAEEIIRDLDKATRGELLKYFDIIATSEDNLLYLHCEYIKWYSSYPEIKAFDDFVDDFEENYENGGIHFVRIGESIEDVEEKYYGEPYDYISIIRATKKPIGLKTLDYDFETKAD